MFAGNPIAPFHAEIEFRRDRIRNVAAHPSRSHSRLPFARRAAARRGAVR